MPEQVIKNNGQNHIHQEYIQKKTSNYLYSSILYNFLCKKKKKKEVRREKNKNFNSQLSFKAYR